MVGTRVGKFKDFQKIQFMDFFYLWLLSVMIEVVEQVVDP